MEEFLELIRVKINSIIDFINRLQTTIGLSNATDESIYGKINALTDLLEQAKVPTYFTENLVVNDNSFVTTHEPINAICLNNEITLYHPDEGTLIWEGLTFDQKIGTLTNANNAYNGWEIKVQYFYYSNLV